MARKRMISPEFWSDDKIGKLTFGARLLFIGMWNFADDYGVLLNSNRRILGNIFPLDEKISKKHILAWKKELSSLKFIEEVQKNDASYLIISNWSKYQRVEHPSKTRWLTDKEISDPSNRKGYSNIPHEPIMNESRTNHDGLTPSINENKNIVEVEVEGGLQEKPAKGKEENTAASASAFALIKKRFNFLLLEGFNLGGTTLTETIKKSIEELELSDNEFDFALKECVECGGRTLRYLKTIATRINAEREKQKDNPILINLSEDEKEQRRLTGLEAIQQIKDFGILN